VGSRPNAVTLARQYGATDIVDYKKRGIIDQVRSPAGSRSRQSSARRKSPKKRCPISGLSSFLTKFTSYAHLRRLFPSLTEQSLRGK
jgi:hypothetical protein